MGDRGNIAIVQDKERKEQVWLYSHWGGYQLPGRLQLGIKAGETRWRDESYLAKIIIGHAVPAESWTDETGYGISTRMQDNGHPILVVDIPGQRVFTMPENLLEDGRVPAEFEPDEKCVWPFADYATLTELPWGKPCELETVGKL